MPYLWCTGNITEFKLCLQLTFNLGLNKQFSSPCLCHSFIHLCAWVSGPCRKQSRVWASVGEVVWMLLWNGEWLEEVRNLGWIWNYLRLWRWVWARGRHGFVPQLEYHQLLVQIVAWRSVALGAVVGVLVLITEGVFWLRHTGAGCLACPLLS